MVYNVRQSLQNQYHRECTRGKTSTLVSGWYLERWQRKNNNSSGPLLRCGEESKEGEERDRLTIRTSHGGLSVPVVSKFPLPGMLVFFVPIVVDLCLLRATIQRNAKQRNLSLSFPALWEASERRRCQEVVETVGISVRMDGYVGYVNGAFWWYAEEVAPQHGHLGRSLLSSGRVLGVGVGVFVLVLFLYVCGHRHTACTHSSISGYWRLYSVFTWH